MNLNRQFVFGINDAVSNSLHCINDDLLCYVGGNNCIVLHDLENSKQNFLCDTIDFFQQISALAVAVKSEKRPSNLLVVAGLDIHHNCTIILLDHQKFQKVKDFRCSDFDSANDFEIVSLSFNNEDQVIVALGLKNKNKWKIICWNVELETPIVESEIVDSSTSPNCVGNVTFHSPISSQLCISIHQNIFYYTLQEYNNITSKAELCCKIATSIYDKDDNQVIQCHCWVNDYTVFGTNKGRLILMNRFLSKDFQVCHDVFLPGNIGCCVDSLVYSKSSGGFIAGLSKKSVQIYSACNVNDPGENSCFLDLFQCIKAFPVESTYFVGEREGRLRSLALSPDENTLFMAASGENQLISVNVGSISSSFHTGSSDSSIVDLQNNLITKCINHGHVGAINSLSICIRKPILITAGIDETVRIWDYNLGCLEICKFFHNEEPLSVALHPSGHHALIGFPNKLQLMNILVDDLQIVRDFPVKMCRECHFSNGGHAFAAAQSNVITIYNFHFGKKRLDFKGHNSKVRRIFWSFDDYSIISTEDDGPIYQWKVETGQRIGEYVSWTTTKGETKYCSSTMMNGKQIFVVENGSIVQLSNENLEIINRFNCNIAPCIGPARNNFDVSHMEPCILFMEQKNSIRAINPCTLANYDILQPGIASISFLSVAYHDNYLIACDSLGCLSIFNIEKTNQFETQQTLITAGKEDTRVVQHFLQCDDVLIRESDVEEIDATLNDLKGKMSELSMQHEYHLRMTEMCHREKLRDMEGIFARSMEEEDLKLQIIEEEMQMIRKSHKDQIRRLEDQVENKEQSCELENQKNVLNEVASYQKAVQICDLEKMKLADQRKNIFHKHESKVKTLLHSFQVKLEEIHKQIADSGEMEATIGKDLTETKCQLEEDVDTEIQSIISDYQNKIPSERVNSLRIKTEIGLFQKKTEFLLNDIKDQKEQINQLENEQEWEEQVENLKKQIQHLDGKIKSKDQTIISKDDTISMLKKKYNELEKFKYVLDDKMAELMSELQPRDKNIENMKGKIRQIDQDLLQYQESNSSLEAYVSKLEVSITASTKELCEKKKKLLKLSQTSDYLHNELFKCSQAIQDPIKLKETLFKIQNYIQDKGIANDISTSSSSGAPVVEGRDNDDRKSNKQLRIQQIRQEELKKEVKILKSKYATDTITFNDDIQINRNRNQNILKSILSLKNKGK